MDKDINMNSYNIIQAYYAKNLGDDMFVQTLVRRYPHELFLIMQSRKQIGDLINEKNIRTPSFPIQLFCKALSKIIRKKDVINNVVCKYAKAVVRIGGSIFIERQNWKENTTKTLNMNTFILGANFGPYISEEYLAYATEQIKQAKDCCWRDRYSYNLFSNILNNVRYAPDILFSYSYLPSEKSGNSIGISVIDFTNRKNLQSEEERYKKGIINICKYYKERKRNVFLFGFCKKEGDEKAIDEILDKLGTASGIKKCIYSGNIESYLQEINKCEKIFATRFHAMIIGWIMKKDVVPIIYSNKQLNVIHDIHFSGVQWDILHHQNLPLDKIEDSNGKLPDDVIHMLRTKASVNFYGLDEFFEKRS